MSKIYGYKEQDVKSLYAFIKENENEDMNEDNGIMEEEDKNHMSAKKISLKKIKINKYRDSDIFNLRLDKSVIEKSGEHSYFKKLLSDENKDNKKLTYNVSNETVLGWGLRRPLPSIYNHTSTKNNLLNRDIKNIGDTKENIINESKRIANGFNPIHKQKSLCEFIDLSRVSAPNINIDYNKAITNNPNVFKRKNEISSEYYDIYGQYSSLCDKPFKKFSPLNP